MRLDFVLMDFPPRKKLARTIAAAAVSTSLVLTPVSLPVASSQACNSGGLHNIEKKPAGSSARNGWLDFITFLIGLFDGGSSSGSSNSDFFGPLVRWLSGLSAGSSKSPKAPGSSDPSPSPMLKGTPGVLPILKGPTQALQMVTGPGALTDTKKLWGVGGTDLGFAVAHEDGTTSFIFGDTESCDGGRGHHWRSNAILISPTQDFAGGVKFTTALTGNGYLPDGMAVQFIQGLKKPGIEHTVIPTTGIEVNGTTFIDYMSIKKWGKPGEWETNYAATIASRDRVHWELVPDSVRMNRRAAVDDPTGNDATYEAGNNHLQMSAFTVDGDFVYRFSTPAGRSGGAVLARTTKKDFPNEKTFTYWDGNSWSSSPANAVEVLKAPVSELSVAWNEYLGKWLALFITKSGMVLSTADSLTGRWSSPTTLVPITTIPDLYGGFVLPGSSGDSLYFVATTWSDYNVWLMRTDLNRLSLAPKPEKPFTTP